MSDHARRNAYVLVAANIAVGSVAFTLVKVALRELSPLGLAAGRVMFSALAFMLAVTLQPWRRTPIRPEHRVRVYLIGFAGSAGFHILFAWGQQHTTVAVASVVMTAMPAVTAIGEVLFLGHRLRRHQVIGLVLSTAGCVLIGVVGGHDSHSSTLLGALSIAGCMLIWSATTVATRSIAHQYDSWWLNTPGTLVGAVVIMAFEVPHAGEFGHLSVKGWFVVAWLGAVSSAFVYYALTKAMQQISATAVTSLSTIVTPSSIIVAWIALGSAPTIVDVLGGAVVIAGALLVCNERLPSTHPAEAVAPATAS